MLSQHAVSLEPTRAHGVLLLPMLRYMDNVSMLRSAYLRDEVFGPGSLVRRSTFIEDTLGKHNHMEAWLASAEYPRRLPPRNGCWLFDDGRGEPMMRHLDGAGLAAVYMDPAEREALGLRPYPRDWTAELTAELADGQRVPKRAHNLARRSS